MRPHSGFVWLIALVVFLSFSNTPVMAQLNRDIVWQLAFDIQDNLDVNVNAVVTLGTVNSGWSSYSYDAGGTIDTVTASEVATGNPLKVSLRLTGEKATDFTVYFPRQEDAGYKFSFSFRAIQKATNSAGPPPGLSLTWVSRSSRNNPQPQDIRVIFPKSYQTVASVVIDGKPIQYSTSTGNKGIIVDFKGTVPPVGSYSWTVTGQQSI